MTLADLGWSNYYQSQQELGRDLAVVTLNAKEVATSGKLAPWVGKGQTVALVGSSGVGKTTLTNALTGEEGATQGIREDDARGRHTTTGRSLHQLPSGGWLIDTPGMRGLGVADVVAGINATFPEISELEGTCKCAPQSMGRAKTIWVWLIPFRNLLS